MIDESLLFPRIQANNLIVQDPSTFPVGYPDYPDISAWNTSVWGCFGSPTVICAEKTPDTDGATCKGDSGGPVVADRDGDGVWVQYGLVSIGTGPDGVYPCGQGTHSGFTDVSQWTDKIISLVEENQ